MLRRHINSVDDVLDSDWQAGEEPGSSSAIGGARLRQGMLGIEPGPGLDRFALLGAIEAGAGQPLGGQCA